ncbi:MAG: membrane protein insertion efficiency factor YidD, partial [Verrucomicrobiota bacterium]|nr:membrane protein insertion efficiency factor YidD [Verrucomicrobiota bacterium]
LIRLYQLTLSPLKNALFGPETSCRFTPTCSEFTLEAIRTHGAIRGTWLGLRRLLRCHPWSNCGHDPVPAKLVR